MADIKEQREVYSSPISDTKVIQEKNIICASDNSTGSNEKYNNWDYEW